MSVETKIEALHELQGVMDNDLIIWRNGHAFATPKLLAQFQDDIANFENEPVIECFIDGETYQDFRKRMDDIGGGTDE